MPAPSASGQATLEYTGVLALVAAALAAAGALAGPGAIAEAVAATVRTGICIVGGDICRRADAAAAGLAPCVLAERREGEGAEISVLVVKLGREGEWAVARRSDGTFLVTRTSDQSVGAGFGFGLGASPLGLKVGAGAKLALVVREGSAWELPDAAAARRLLESDDRPPPDWRFGDAGSELAADAGVKAGGAMLVGLETGASLGAGVRVGRGRTTLYLKARLDAPTPTVWMPGGRRSYPGSSTGDMLVEFTRAGDEPRELAFRTVERAGARKLVETVARLDLRVPANREVAERLLRRPAPYGALVAGDLRDVIRHTVVHGTVERSTYATATETRRIELAARLGLELGIDARRVESTSHLTSAHAWTQGTGPRERVDCTGG